MYPCCRFPIKAARDEPVGIGWGRRFILSSFFLNFFVFPILIPLCVRVSAGLQGRDKGRKKARTQQKIGFFGRFLKYASRAGWVM